MRRFRKAELARVIRAAMKRNANLATRCSTSHNPQVIEMRIRAEAKREALLAVYDWIESDRRYLLNIEAAGRIDAKEGDAQ